MSEHPESSAPRVPDAAPDEAVIVATARDIGLGVDASCLPGVVANRALLRRYADLVHGFALPDTCEPAFEYRP
ncbi:DUF4089 domain-containing protein [Gluconacetobacter takamatsuzukensis]|uniref:DUF4089 domain-containing protein n=1 Tax=Gluconacetobacter takamatsuzukensis TaxID=1286190 RepID=A0A7W4PNE6_9PROT|nr:DUF4089 domain-containing protein [Gluconacetobacter takamatsuzukensis]MBB2204487.1 DUF4089 domain-containing protein [Gluconacetobacter takamatsuzukensis]